ncbi:MAG: endolytic transglycosylase MltG [Chloroflexota bacterium]|nr:endolytic transglycosylase MltG [Chloroflexota bacterium]
MKRSPYLAIFILVLIAALGLALLFLIGLPSLQNHLTSTFGPPAPNLDFFDQLTLSFRLLQYRDNLTTPANPHADETPFHVDLGESPTSISQRLQEQSLIQNASAFRIYLIYSGIDTQIQAGDYDFSPTSSPIEIAAALMDPNPTAATLVILAGWRLEEIGASLPTSGLAIDPETFITVGKNAEGHLLPCAYSIPRTTTAAALLQILQASFDQAVSDEMQAGFEQQGLSLTEAVILASIVERESVVVDEMPQISSVFLNRLGDGIKLDADPTVQYAIGYNQSQETWWTNPISATDLQYDSPYNTYIYPGLPPSPICNPSINALQAVAFPAQTPYYYFRSACDNSGRHTFAETFEEHVGNECP